jgi:hypothetical protein
MFKALSMFNGLFSHQKRLAEKFGLIQTQTKTVENETQSSEPKRYFDNINLEDLIDEKIIEKYNNIHNGHLNSSKNELYKLKFFDRHLNKCINDKVYSIDVRKPENTEQQTELFKKNMERMERNAQKILGKNSKSNFLWDNVKFEQDYPVLNEYRQQGRYSENILKKMNFKNFSLSEQYGIHNNF